ncbi:response regulator transcription factor [Variovorax sp. J22G73]|uniref:response regulator transcription factor n=1 Tax=unclassified Variovorax TaxID=663243 RepID=UPI002577D877|nr:MULTISPECIES: response regulator transcription factor [unclassified Variovorax]MDM0010579.1 response regulator transcription factor [Variovorax sp. J22R203]MDM0103092.1 response regulator transcription factor [Variovorax sp. J22G73]
MRILVLEDLPESASYYRNDLEKAGFLVDVATTSESARGHLRSWRYGVVIIDVASPNTDYRVWLQDVRRRSTAQILVVSPRDKLAHRMEGLRLGATEYLIKPLFASELVVKVTALRRQQFKSISTTLKIADIEVDIHRRKAKRGPVQISFSRREFSLLMFLLQNQGRIFSSSALAGHVWGAHAENLSNVVEVTIGRLRNKLEQPPDIKLLHTVRGLGYVLEIRPPTWLEN